MPNNSLFSVLSVISLWSLSSVLGLFLSCCLFLCSGFAPLLLPAHFLKSSARPVQPTQPGRLHTDQRSVDIHTLPLSLSPTRTRTHINTHSLLFITSLPPQCRPAPCSRQMKRETSPLILPPLSPGALRDLCSLTAKL